MEQRAELDYIPLSCAMIRFSVSLNGILETVYIERN